MTRMARTTFQLEDIVNELTLEHAAAMAGVSLRTLYRRIAAGEGPAVVRRGKRAYVSETAAREWLAQRAEPRTVLAATHAAA